MDCQDPRWIERHTEEKYEQWKTEKNKKGTENEELSVHLMKWEVEAKQDKDKHEEGHPKE